MRTKHRSSLEVLVILVVGLILTGVYLYVNAPSKRLVEPDTRSGPAHARAGDDR